MSFSEATTAASTPVTTRPPTLYRRQTSPSLSSAKDIEAQSFRRFERPSGIQRTSTLNTSASSIPEDAEHKFERRDTITLTEVGQTLEKTETWVVEDEAQHGYPKLARFLGSTEGYAIYKRFASLNARNLLYHQAKLTHLEHQLNELEKDMAHETHLHHSVHHIFDTDVGSSGYALRKKYEEVSHALDKYNRLLLDQKRLHELPSPDDSFVDSIHNFINNEKAPHPGWLQHPENTIYAVYDDDRKPVQKDLVTLNPEFRTQDPFTKFFTGTLLEWWHRFVVSLHLKKPDEDDGYTYQEKALGRAMRVVVLIVASALPTCSIVALYFIYSPIWRLVFIVLFSLIFAAALAFFTDAKRVEVFAASAALASVQVVFVGTAFGNGNSNG